MPDTTVPAGSTALVAKSAKGAFVLYLQLDEANKPVWVQDLQAATPFASMREATRMALRLPALDRAFGLPLAAERSLSPDICQAARSLPPTIH